MTKREAAPLSMPAAGGRTPRQTAASAHDQNSSAPVRVARVVAIKEPRRAKRQQDVPATTSQLTRGTSVRVLDGSLKGRVGIVLSEAIDDEGFISVGFPTGECSFYVDPTNDRWFQSQLVEPVSGKKPRLLAVGDRVRVVEASLPHYKRNLRIGQEGVVFDVPLPTLDGEEVEGSALILFKGVPGSHWFTYKPPLLLALAHTPAYLDEHDMYATVVMGGRVVEVPVARGLELSVGCEVVINLATLEIQRVLPLATCGSVATVQQTLDGARCLVAFDGRRIAVHCGSSTEKLRRGDRVLIDPAQFVVLEKVRAHRTASNQRNTGRRQAR